MGVVAESVNGLFSDRFAIGCLFDRVAPVDAQYILFQEPIFRFLQKRNAIVPPKLPTSLY